MDEIHPVDSNLVLSTDDTILFVFEGTSNDGCNDDWEWKLVDKTEAGSSVHSDFQVSNIPETGGGFRVRLMIVQSHPPPHRNNDNYDDDDGGEAPTRKNH